MKLSSGLSDLALNQPHTSFLHRHVQPTPTPNSAPQLLAGETEVRFPSTHARPFTMHSPGARACLKSGFPSTHLLPVVSPFPFGNKFYQELGT